MQGLGTTARPQFVDNPSAKMSFADGLSLTAFVPALSVALVRFPSLSPIHIFASARGLSPTDELLVALCHDTPVGRARICSWDPCTSGTIP